MRNSIQAMVLNIT